MKLKDIIKKTRSYRRFEGRKISRKILVELVELARLSASSGNRQPLKYILSNTKKKNNLIFSTLSWARDLLNWPGPDRNQRPTAYIVILGDRRILDSFGCDFGIAAWSILLGATQNGLGGCMVASIDKNALKSLLKIQDHYEILLVVALGRPAEKVIIKDAPRKSDIRYYRDIKNRHIVPKRTIGELIID